MPTWKVLFWGKGKACRYHQYWAQSGYSMHVNQMPFLTQSGHSLSHPEGQVVAFLA